MSSASTSPAAVVPGGSGAPLGTARETWIVTWLLVGFLVWVPLQTPVDVLAYQYLHVPVRVAQSILLIKDVWAAGLFLFLLVRHFREVRFHWFDWFALVFAVLVGVYSVVPTLLGSRLPALAVFASARELLVPVELYGLGRLAGYAGVSPVALARAFLVVAAGAAVFSVTTFVVFPQSFWTTTYNLLGFMRDVQAISTDTTLRAASIVAQYGPSGTGLTLRAVGPFTHPVGAAVYYALPMTLVLCAAWAREFRSRAAILILAVAVVLFWMAVMTPISRGIWIGLAGSAIIVGVVLHRFRVAVLTVAFFAAFIWFVPPFSYSVTSAANGTDTNTTAHAGALGHGADVVSDNPFGLGVGQADVFGQAYSSSAGVESAGVGENMYLAIYTSVGPLGLLAFVIWLAAILAELLLRVRRSLPQWVAVGVGAGLLAEAAAAMSASTLMRFTTAASVCLLVGLVISAPSSEFRWPKLWAAFRARAGSVIHRAAALRHGASN